VSTPTERILEATHRLARDAERIPLSAWATKLPIGTWSPCEVVEHVALANLGMARRFTGIAEHPLDGAALPIIDDEIPFLFYGGEEPPNVATPTGTWTDRDRALGELAESAAGIVAAAEAADVDLRTVGAPHFAFGLLDGVQWLLFSFAHTERHRAEFRRLLAAQ
jgi:DinB superfamily